MSGQKFTSDLSKYSLRFPDFQSYLDNVAVYLDNDHCRVADFVPELKCASSS